MVQYVKNLTIEIVADITQVPHFVTEECISYFDFGSVKIRGNYGYSCWWLPLGIFGLKIWNRASIESRVDRWNELNKAANYCKLYLPEVYMALIVRHTGSFVRGGSVRHKGKNESVEYATFVMRNYKRPKSVGKRVMDSIQGAFTKDGIELHGDTLRREQLGEFNNSIVVLDITDKNKKEYL